MKSEGGWRAVPLPSLGVVGATALAALVAAAAGIDLIPPASASNAPPPLSLLAAELGAVEGATTGEQVPAAVMPGAPARIRLVFSLSQTPPQDDTRPTAADWALASAQVPPGDPPEASWHEAAIAADRPITVIPRYAPALVRPPTPPAGEAVPPAPVKKPRVVAHTGPADALPWVKQKPRAAGPSVAAVIAHFESVGYDLDQVRAAARPVPRLYLEALPRDLADVSSTNARKRLFVQVVLPFILRVNEEIAAARWRVERLGDRVMWADALSAADREWLVAMADFYGAVPFDVPDLLSRLDIVPPSLALAQAAEESGWGTSRFVREGNALFGQYTYKAKPGMVPARRDADKRHRVRSHENLLDAVRAYVHNLNTHWAYQDFRSARAGLRRAGSPITGDALAGELRQYSERRAAYVQAIRQIIRQNRLGEFDQAWLNNRQWTAVFGPPNKRPPI